MRNLSFYKNSTSLNHNNKGNVFALLFAAVAMVGVLGVVGMQTISGPVRTITKVTQKNITDTDLMTNARIVILNASTLASSGDADADGYIEPVEYTPTSDANCDSAPTGGGCLPLDIGAILTDPWGTDYGYCVWDHGSVDAGRDDGGTGTDDRLQGEDSTSQPVLAIISAGPDRAFDTVCGAFDSSGTDGLSDSTGAGDDYIRFYTYEAALAGSGGLWTETGNDAMIANPNVTDEIILGSGATVDISGVNTGTAGTGSFPALQTDFISSQTGGTTPVEMVTGLRLESDDDYSTCNAGAAGVIIYNNEGGNERLQICNGTSYVDVGSDNWRIIDSSYDSDTYVSVAGTTNTDTETILFHTDGSDRMTISSTGVVAMNDDLVVDTDTLFVDASADAVGVNNAAPSAALDVTGDAEISTDLTVDTDTLFVDSTNDRVGIGTTSPARQLHLSGTGVANGIAFDDGSYIFAYNGGNSFGIWNDSGATQRLELAASGIIGYSSHGYEVNASSDITFVTRRGSDVGIGGASSLDFYGNNATVGMSLTNSDLTVQGYVVLGTGSCAAGSEGAIQYTSSDNIEYCNGTSWQTISGNVSELRDIENVNIVSDPTDGYVLQWDNGDSEWEAVDPTGLTVGTSSSSGQTALLIDDDDDTYIDVDTAGDGSANTIMIVANNTADASSTEAIIIDPVNDLVTIASGHNESNNFLELNNSVLSLNTVGNSTTSGEFRYNQRATSVGGVLDKGYDYTAYQNTSVDGAVQYAKIRMSRETMGADRNALSGYLSFHTRELNGISSDTSSGERLRITSVGNVLIGTSVADGSAILQVDSTDQGFLPPRVANEAAMVGTTAGLMMYDESTNNIKFHNGTSWIAMDGSSGTAIIDEIVDTGDGNTSIDVDADDADTNNTTVFTNDGTQSMIIDANGNVGIGTIAAPLTALQIDDTTYTFAGGGLSFGDGDSGLYESADDALGLYIAGSERVTITSGMVKMFTGAQPAMRAVTAGNPAFTVRGTDYDTGMGRPALDQTDTLALYTAGVERVNIAADGSVGIANGAPDVELDVGGSIEFSGTITDVSDRRLKTNIHPLDANTVIEKLSMVDTYSFTMKDDPDGQIEFGVMAQELEKLFPELVKTAKDEMGTKSVNYMGLIAPMIEATKSLQAENTVLKMDVETLKNAQNNILNDVRDIKVQAEQGFDKTSGFSFLMLILAVIFGGATAMMATRLSRKGA